MIRNGAVFAFHAWYIADQQEMVLDQPQAEAEKSPPQNEKIGKITILIQHVYSHMRHL